MKKKFYCMNCGRKLTVFNGVPLHSDTLSSRDDLCSGPDPSGPKPTTRQRDAAIRALKGISK